MKENIRKNVAAALYDVGLTMGMEGKGFT